MNDSKTEKDFFKSLHLQYHPMVLQMCLGYMKGNEELAKDLAQEVFIRIWSALPGFKGASSIKTWIYRITVNTCLLYIRSNKNKQTTSLDEIRSEQAVYIENKGDKAPDLYKAIGALRGLDRLIIMLLLEELEYEEIAKITGISSINLRVRIYRIKKKMKEFLNNGPDNK